MSAQQHDLRGSLSRFADAVHEWVCSPFSNMYRWLVVLVAFGGACLALPAWPGVVVFVPVACLLMGKVANVSRGILSFSFIELSAEQGRPVLSTQRDRLQRAWSLACAALTVAVTLVLACRALLATFAQIEISSTVRTYMGLLGILLGGFLSCYFLALRFDRSILRGLTSVVVTLPVFLILFVLASVLFSWASSTLTALGIPVESMFEYGRDWLYEVQHLLGLAMAYFLEQDVTIVVVSIVFAALLLLLYTISIPAYWIESVSKWLRGINMIAAVLGAGVLIFAGVWLADVQEFAADSISRQLMGEVLDTSALDSEADSLSGYGNSEFIALIRSFVLPYIVGVFVANIALSWRRDRARAVSNGIIDQFAANGSVDESELPELEKRYLYYGGSQTLWDIALRSIGHDVPLPHPFAPRQLTIAERISGVIADPSPEQDGDNVRGEG